MTARLSALIHHKKLFSTNQLWGQSFSPSAALSLILLLLAVAHVLLASGKHTHTQQATLSPCFLLSHTHSLHKDRTCPPPYSSITAVQTFLDSLIWSTRGAFQATRTHFLRCLDVQMYADVRRYIARKVERCLKWQMPDVCCLLTLMWPACL